MVKIALDIDSTLHHYWDVLARVVLERHGLPAPYETQRDWGIAGLDRRAATLCVEQSHSEENILGGVPYEGAVETVRDWHAQGHWIHGTSHRRPETTATTSRWLEQIGIPFDDLRCDFDKVTHCAEIGIQVLVDDSPVNITRAIEVGIVPATLVHPWNERLAERGDVISARDWRELRERLDPVLERLG